MLNRELELPVEKIVLYVSKLQQDDGSFTGDKWGEIDTRYSFCALACLSLLVSILYSFILLLLIKNITQLLF